MRTASWNMLQGSDVVERRAHAYQMKQFFVTFYSDDLFSPKTIYNAFDRVCVSARNVHHTQTRSHPLQLPNMFCSAYARTKFQSHFPCYARLILGNPQMLRHIADARTASAASAGATDCKCHIVRGTPSVCPPPQFDGDCLANSMHVKAELHLLCQS